MATTTTTTPTKPAHSSFYYRVSNPEDILETMVRKSMAFMEHDRRSGSIRKKDVQRALESMKFTVVYSSPVDGRRDELFAARVKCLMHHTIKIDIPVTDGALDLLQLVEHEYRNEANFRVETTSTPSTKGGRILKLESPTGVSAGYFEFDWNQRVEGKGDDEEEWDDANAFDDTIEEDDDSDDESIIRRAMLVDEEDDDDDYDTDFTYDDDDDEM